MTRAQWKRFVGTFPSMSAEGSPLRPVRGVSQVQCDTVTRRLGLALPTEEQWEYAARAGTTTIWWTGDEESSLQGAENLYDQARFRKMPETTSVRGNEPFDWDDGYASESDIGSFRANPFGLHDVQGNVSEWCSSPRYRYPDQPLEEVPVCVERCRNL